MKHFYRNPTSFINVKQQYTFLTYFRNTRENTCLKIREDRPGGGVSLFVKKELRYELKEDIILDLPDVDTIAIEISNKDLNSLYCLS